jgi:hypothetical protein
MELHLTIVSRILTFFSKRKYSQSTDQYPWGNQLCLVKYFHHANTDLRSDIQSHHNSQKAHLPEGIWRGNLKKAPYLLLHGSFKDKAASPSSSTAASPSPCPYYLILL